MIETDSPVMFSLTCTQHDDGSPCQLQRQAAVGLDATRRTGAQAVTISVMDARDPGHVAVAALGSIGTFMRAQSALQRHRQEHLGERPSVAERVKQWFGGFLG